MIRLLRRLLVALLVLVVVLVLVAWLALRASLPRYDGAIENAAVSAPVEVERDALGSVTLHAQNRADLTWALGYVHAQERFFEMDLLRRRAAGELSEVFGAIALPTDRKARAHRMRERAVAALATLDEVDRKNVETYRDGVNAGLAALGARPFPYLLTRTTPAPWRSEDTLLVVDAMYFTLNDGENTRELALARMKAALPASAFAYLTATGGNWDAPLTGPPMTWPDPPPASDIDLHSLDPALLRGTEPAGARVPGSNSFAVVGALTGGAAIVANDMHLDLRVPNLWFRTRMIYPNPRRAGETIDVVGVTLPGTQALVVGSNRKVAWGFTNSYGDFTDWVRVIAPAGDKTHYRSRGESRDVVEHVETIRVRGGADESLTVRDTEWGPILAEDVDGTPLALAWTAQQPDAVNVELMALETAETADEAAAIAQKAGMPAQNFVVADAAGSIEWTIAGKIPHRIGGYDATLPSDWSEAGTGWDGWVAAADYPLIGNPPWQRLWTANARTIEGAHLAVLGDGGYDLGARAGQIRDDLRARDAFKPEDMLAIQLDDRALFLERWKVLLAQTLDRADASPAHDRLKAALADWNGHAAVDSVAYRLVRDFRREVHATILDAFAGAVRKRFPDFTMPSLPQVEHAVWQIAQGHEAHLLPPTYADWQALLIGAADRVEGRLNAQPGGIAKRTWGEANTSRIRHPLAGALPSFLARFLEMPTDPLPGDSNMPRVQGAAFGASERFAVAPGDEAHGYLEMPGGQSGHPLSPYFGSGHADWEQGKPTPLLPGASEHNMMFRPAAAAK